MTGSLRLHMAPGTDKTATWSCPVDIYRVVRTRMKEKKDPAILEAFLSLVLLIFLRYNPRKSMTGTHSRAAIELSTSTHSFH